MPPRPRSSSGFRCIRLLPSGVYYAEIRSNDACLGLGTFETAHEVSHVYDAAAWRLRRPWAQMNFFDMRTREQAQELTPPPRLIFEEDRRVQQRRGRRFIIAVADEHAMAV
ncbi:ethylene-responsive transcription factor RAP2-13-like [Aegilops tauschii subsp. strangulata]|uniref:ethylene-responsive transcription factor RAP2-13-like n=1 Tax=Aegilops tauschii subsp. strangulata TaxID=200361 RepID=UPI00098B000D|nr:ethylene-responsive transcription factor RAP2-13-like [Aegilops tauschii subsp. strangulata]